MAFQGFKTLGENCLSEHIAVIESIYTDFLQTLAEGNGFQLLAVFKSVVADFHHGIGDDDLGNAGIGEKVIGYFVYAASKGYTADAAVFKGPVYGAETGGDVYSLNGVNFGESRAADRFKIFGVLFGIRMARGDFGFDRISMSLFGAFIMPVLFSLLVLLRAGEDWSRVVLLPFIVAWASDTGAYFAGSFFGKHKLCPSLSPKKTVEGAIGGLLLAAVGGVVYGLIVGKADLILLAVIGLLGSAVGQFGDLMFSCIKREYGIKDYGKLMPGHGGVLDRFDSSVVTIPLVWLILRIVSL